MKIMLFCVFDVSLSIFTQPKTGWLVSKTPTAGNYSQQAVLRRTWEHSKLHVDLPGHKELRLIQSAADILRPRVHVSFL